MPDRAPDRTEPSRRTDLADPDRLMRTCPICGKELAERKCKLYCPDPRCNYFLSCADYF
jgi:hypothetical protein